MSDSTEAVESKARNFRVIALIVASAMVMEQLDATVLTTALPTMARDFGTTAPAMSVALTSYLLALAIFIPASGRVADRFGAKTVFRAAIGIFTLGSIFCALSPSLTLLVAARLLQGLGGAMMLPVGRLVLMRSVERREMVSAMSWVLVPALIGPILGPPVGGLIITHADWRWIFYINVPIGLLGMALVTRFIQDVPGERPRSFDVPGMLLSGLSLGTLFFGFELTSHPGAGNIVMALLCIGVVSGAAYIRHARLVSDPILDLSLMQVPSFGTALMAGSFTRITQGAAPFMLPLMMQLEFGLSPAASGSMVIATAFGSLAMKPLIGRILRAFGFRASLIVNGVVATLTYGLCALFSPAWPYPSMFLVLVASGFFMSFQFTAYNTVAYDNITAQRMSSATSFYSTFQQLMLSVGICVASLALQGSMLVRGHAEPGGADFSTAFMIVTGISLAALVWNFKFAPDAGTEISGHRPRRHAMPSLQTAKSA